MKAKLGFIRIINFSLLICLWSCDYDENKLTDFHQKKVDSIYYFQTRLDSMYVFAEIGEEKTLNKFVFMDLEGNRVGNSLEFYPNGGLKKRSNYLKGKQVGEERIFDELGNLIWFYNYANDEKHGIMYEYYQDGSLKQHKIFDHGDPIYSAFYEDKLKQVEIIHPTIISERTTNGNYELTGNFKHPFEGVISAKIESLEGAEVSFSTKSNFKILIKDFDEIEKYDVTFIFEPGGNDTIRHSKYIYQHQVVIE
jgi:hypothetical protein